MAVNAETKSMTTDECLVPIRSGCDEMLMQVQYLLETYPMDSQTRGNLNSIRFNLKMILED